MIKPSCLMPGDRVCVVAPASPFDPAALKEGVEALRSLGLDVKLPENIDQRHPTLEYLAGTDADRLQQLVDAFSDKEVKAIFCARGGYGSMRLLSMLKPETITKNPKIFVGYSDITTFLNFLTTNYSMVTFHGPVVAKDLDRTARPKTLSWLQKAIMEKDPIGDIDVQAITGHPPVTIHPGSARGILVGGNLTLIAASLGTDFEINTDGKILFLEDRGERPYRIDRLLMQLKLSKKFKKVAGVLLGEFTDAQASEGQLMEMFRDVFADLEVPILYGFPAGHCDEKVTLPLGVSVVLNADQGILQIVESGVV